MCSLKKSFHFSQDARARGCSRDLYMDCYFMLAKFKRIGIRLTLAGLSTAFLVVVQGLTEWDLVFWWVQCSVAITNVCNVSAGLDYLLTFDWKGTGTFPINYFNNIFQRHTYIIYCQAQVQSQIQVLNPNPKSKIQSPEERNWDWGWHYNPTGHTPHQHS